MATDVDDILYPKTPWFLPPNPFDWPQWARRAFLLTIPISGALWVLWWVAIVAGIFVVAAAAALFIVLAHVVAPFVAVGCWVWEKASELWN